MKIGILILLILGLMGCGSASTPNGASSALVATPSASLQASPKAPQPSLFQQWSEVNGNVGLDLSHIQLNQPLYALFPVNTQIATWATVTLEVSPSDPQSYQLVVTDCADAGVNDTYLVSFETNNDMRLCASNPLNTFGCVIFN